VDSMFALRQHLLSISKDPVEAFTIEGPVFQGCFLAGITASGVDG
jgi:hypothetical protein